MSLFLIFNQSKFDVIVVMGIYQSFKIVGIAGLLECGHIDFLNQIIIRAVGIAFDAGRGGSIRYKEHRRQNYHRQGQANVGNRLFLL